MATYNGAEFVREQLVSILDEIGSEDEVIVFDDASTDTTAMLIERFSDSRIRLMRSRVNGGHVRAFENAIGASTGDYIFLADQDDIWIPGRVDLMLDCLQRHPVTAGNFSVLGAKSDTSAGRLRASDTGASLKNLIGIFAGTRPYFGSAMGLRREVIPLVLPIPRYVEAHDLWLAIVGNMTGGIEHCEDPVLLRRLHSGNLTPTKRRGIGRIVVSRVGMLRAVAEVTLRRRRIGVTR